jgi:Fe-S oxidoreductase
MAVASRTYCIDEYMIRPDRGEKPRILRVADHISNKSKSRRVLLHGHCYLKAKPLAVDGFPTGVKATIDMLEAVGYQMELIEAGCCGMAGAFGYEAEHYDVSMRVGELGLFPYIRKSDQCDHCCCRRVLSGTNSRRNQAQRCPSYNIT